LIITKDGAVTAPLYYGLVYYNIKYCIKVYGIEKI
jgi:hypothetical protein